MYNAWKYSAGERPERSFESETMVIPDSVRQSVHAGRWHLPANLIRATSQRRRREPATTSSKDATIVTPLATVANAATAKPSPAPGVSLQHQKLTAGFELVFRLLARGVASWAAPPTSLSRADLEESASRWCCSVGLSQAGQARLRQLISDFWTLIESLLPQKPDGRLDSDPRRPVTMAAIARGLRERVRTNRDQMELRRRLLQLAVDAFEVVASIVDVGKTPSAWKTGVFKAAAAAGLDPAKVQTAFAAAAAAAAATPSLKERRLQLDDSQLRQAWVRMILEPFF